MFIFRDHPPPALLQVLGAATLTPGRDNDKVFVWPTTSYCSVFASRISQTALFLFYFYFVVKQEKHAEVSAPPHHRLHAAN